MNTDTHFHVIKDPVQGTMQFTTTENNWLKPFIDSPPIQRLRHIKQLGMSDYIFPGAVHTRFNHCLGCSYVASQIADKIGLGAEERQLVMLACLLHDLGHGPFSHTFEDLFVNKLIRHEAWTPFFLADYRTDIFLDEYNRLNPRHPLTSEKLTIIETMITHQATVKKVLADIVSSQLDADRLDYLLRDSHFCGVTYGQFDLRWMLNCMTIVPGPQGERLGLTHKGLGVVEHYLMARRLMTRNIYFHHKKLGMEFFLIQMLGHLAKQLAVDNSESLIPIKATRLGKFLVHVGQFNEAVQTTKDCDHLKKQFLQNNYPLYKELCDYDIFMLIKLLAHLPESSTITEIAKRLQYRHMPKIVRLDHADTAIIGPLLAQFKDDHATSLEDWQLALIRSPHQSYTGEEDPILIINENGTIKPLNEISLLVQAVSDKLEHTVFLCVDQAIYHRPEVQGIIKKLSGGQ